MARTAHALAHAFTFSLTDTQPSMLSLWKSPIPFGMRDRWLMINSALLLFLLWPCLMIFPPPPHPAASLILFRSLLSRCPGRGGRAGIS